MLLPRLHAKEWLPEHFGRVHRAISIDDYLLLETGQFPIREAFAIHFP